MSTGEFDKPFEMTRQGNPAEKVGMMRADADRQSLNESSGDRTTRFPSVVTNQLRHHLYNTWATILIKAPESPKTLLFCGANSGEGTSFVSYHLALFLCLEYNLRILYVETDPDGQRPYPALPDGEGCPGLAAYFNEDRPLGSLILETETPGFHVLPDASRSDMPGISKIISEKEAVRQLMHYCSEQYDVTVFDGQPVLKSPRVIGFARAVDQVLFVCRYAVSRREVSRLAIEKLHQGGVNIMGVLLNDRQYPVPARIYRSLK